MRILLFLATNIAILLLASAVLNLLGFSSYITAQGLNLTALLVFCAVFGFAGSFISLLLSKWMAKRMTGLRLITQPANSREQWLVHTVEDLAQQAGIGTPEIGIFPGRSPNAFATGASRNKALVAVNTALLDSMNQNQVKAVLAHEIGHVANGDMVTLALIQGVVNTFVMFFARIIGYFIDRVVFRNQHGLGFGYYIVVFACEIFLAVLASMIVMWFSRRREFRADAWGAKLAGSTAMISALESLGNSSAAMAKNRMSDTDQKDMPEEFQAFAISGKIKHGLARAFSSHPPIEERIEALKSSNSLL